MFKIKPRAFEFRIHLLRILVAFLGLGAAIAASAQSFSAVGIGSKVDNFQMTDASGNIQSLQLYAGKIVVFFFWSFKCPVSLAYADRMEALNHKYGSRGVVLLGVASGINESQEEIQANVANLKITAPILLDSEGDLMDKLEATHTPSVFIFDQNAVLRYKGAADNNKPPGDKGRVSYLDDAIDSLLDGRSIAVPETQVFGCSIRRRRIKE